jgi:hypothetical protein
VRVVHVLSSYSLRQLGRPFAENFEQVRVVRCRLVPALSEDQERDTLREDHLALHEQEATSPKQTEQGSAINEVGPAYGLHSTGRLHQILRRGTADVEGMFDVLARPGFGRRTRCTISSRVQIALPFNGRSHQNASVACYAGDSGYWHSCYLLAAPSYLITHDNVACRR